MVGRLSKYHGDAGRGLGVSFYVGFPKGKSHIWSSSAMWMAGGMVGFVHESETSQMGMRNANYLLTQYTLLEWFSGFNYSILKVFLDKYRRNGTKIAKTFCLFLRSPIARSLI